MNVSTVVVCVEFYFLPSHRKFAFRFFSKHNIFLFFEDVIDDKHFQNGTTHVNYAVMLLPQLFKKKRNGHVLANLGWARSNFGIS